MTQTETYIPLRRSDVMELCAKESANQQEFLEFAQLLLALLHHEYLQVQSQLKDAYAPFNPDRDTISLEKDVDLVRLANNLTKHFEEVLESANYIKLSQPELQQALNESSLIPLNTYVNLTDYVTYAFYFRGKRKKTIPLKILWKEKEAEIENLERVAVLLHFRERAYFEAKTRKEKKKQADFVPGMIYLYLYKNVPNNDLELLFPNVEISMTWRDKLLFAIPALSGLGPLIIKVLPSLGLLVGAILLLTMGPEFAARLNFEPSKNQAIYPIIVAALSTSFLLGGFAVKQYLNYKNKKLKFQKRVTDTLFFKNLVTNRGVLFTIVDSAEEELGKEMVLAYHHLVKANRPLKTDELDTKVEQWLSEHCGRTIDFDVSKALNHLASYNLVEKTAVEQDSGYWSAASLQTVKQILDERWDNLYQY